MITRRASMKLLLASTAVVPLPASFALAGQAAVPEAAGAIQFFTTTQRDRWQRQPSPSLGPLTAGNFERSADLLLDNPAQTIQGIGGAFSEKGWKALAKLPAPSRDQALRALFAADGAAFSLCRTPIGANDIADDWYSYDEVPGDFDLKYFSIDKDRDTLIPFIQAAQQINPNIAFWASPWSPPTWMKKNGHYAQAPAWPGGRDNGIRPNQIMKEGQDTLIQEDRYLDAFARYFRRYVEAYGKLGIRIGQVMPQNEFNSPHPFPGCCWSAEGLSRFIPYLHRELSPLGVDVLLGTLERDKPEVVDKVMADPTAGPLVKGVGVQWAGKGALKDIHIRHPGLAIWGSEQECGNGANDWRYARYGWSLMRQYFNSGASVWQYWNLAMPVDGMSGWGWPQNALVSIDTHAGTWRLTHDYWVMRHLSAFVRPGARFIPSRSFFAFENQLAFRNPNGDLVIVAHNDLADPQRLVLALGGRELVLNLPADSFSTVLLPASLLAA